MAIPPGGTGGRNEGKKEPHKTPNPTPGRGTIPGGPYSAKRGKGFGGASPQKRHAPLHGKNFGETKRGLPQRGWFPGRRGKPPIPVAP